MNFIKTGLHWDRFTATRILLAAGSLIGFLLASGAGEKWL